MSGESSSEINKSKNDATNHGDQKPLYMNGRAERALPKILIFENSVSFFPSHENFVRQNENGMRIVGEPDATLSGTGTPGSSRLGFLLDYLSETRYRSEMTYAGYREILHRGLL